MVEIEIARILIAIEATGDNFATPLHLLESHDLSDIFRACAKGLITTVRKTDGSGDEGFALTAKGKQTVGRPATPPGTQLVNIATVRRDLQQLAGIVQDLSAKVARLDALANTTSVTLAGHDAFDAARLRLSNDAAASRKVAQDTLRLMEGIPC